MAVGTWAVEKAIRIYEIQVRWLGISILMVSWVCRWPVSKLLAVVVKFLALDVEIRFDLVDVLSHFKSVPLWNLIPLEKVLQVLTSFLVCNRSIAHHLFKVFVHVDSLMSLLHELNSKLFHYHFVKFFDSSQVQLWGRPNNRDDLDRVAPQQGVVFLCLKNGFRALLQVGEVISNLSAGLDRLHKVDAEL